MKIRKLDLKIYSVFVLNKEFDDKYNKAAWQLLGSNYVILHRLCVNAKVQLSL